MLTRGCVDVLGGVRARGCKTLYLCTDKNHLNTCSEFVDRGLCFESVHTDKAARLATNTLTPLTTELRFYPNRTDHSRLRVWMGSLYFCVQDYNAFTTTAAGGVTKTDAFSQAANFYTATHFCVQALGRLNVAGSSAGSSTYALVTTTLPHFPSRGVISLACLCLAAACP